MTKTTSWEPIGPRGVASGLQSDVYTTLRRFLATVRRDKAKALAQDSESDDEEVIAEPSPKKAKLEAWQEDTAGYQVPFVGTAIHDPLAPVAVGEWPTGLLQQCRDEDWLTPAQCKGAHAMKLYLKALREFVAVGRQLDKIPWVVGAMSSERQWIRLVLEIVRAHPHPRSVLRQVNDKTWRYWLRPKVDDEERWKVRKIIFEWLGAILARAEPQVLWITQQAKQHGLLHVSLQQLVEVEPQCEETVGGMLEALRRAMVYQANNVFTREALLNLVQLAKAAPSVESYTSILDAVDSADEEVSMASIESRRLLFLLLGSPSQSPVLGDESLRPHVLRVWTILLDTPTRMLQDFCVHCTLQVDWLLPALLKQLSIPDPSKQAFAWIARMNLFRKLQVAHGSIEVPSHLKKQLLSRALQSKNPLVVFETLKVLVLLVSWRSVVPEAQVLVSLLGRCSVEGSKTEHVVLGLLCDLLRTQSNVSYDWSKLLGKESAVFCSAPLWLQHKILRCLQTLSLEKVRFGPNRALDRSHPFRSYRSPVACHCCVPCCPSRRRSVTRPCTNSAGPWPQACSFQCSTRGAPIQYLRHPCGSIACRWSTSTSSNDSVLIRLVSALETMWMRRIGGTS